MGNWAYVDTTLGAHGGTEPYALEPWIVSNPDIIGARNQHEEQITVAIEEFKAKMDEFSIRFAPQPTTSGSLRRIARVSPRTKFAPTLPRSTGNAGPSIVNR